ncbi:MAG: NHLP leader peptide family RiPP precursor [Parachlamydiaceae bacterium]
MNQIGTKNEIEQLIIKKIEEDKNFERLLSSNPHEALKTLGVAIPKDIHVKIISEAKGELILVIPCTNQDTDQLTELELIHSLGGSTARCDLSLTR